MGLDLIASAFRAKGPRIVSDRTPQTPAQRGAPRPKIEMRELNPFFGGACLLAAVGAFLTTAYFAAVALALVGVAFLIFWRDLRPWEQIPRWKRVTVTTLIFLGGACLIVYLIIMLGIS
jgi:hypothetical protein